MTTLKKELDETKIKFLEVFELTAGNISSACTKMQISRETYYRWRREHSEFDAKCEEVQESLIDMAETMLLKAIKNGNTAEIIFFLKTKGKKRGYIERSEFEFSKPKYDMSGFTNEELLAVVNGDDE